MHLRNGTMVNPSRRRTNNSPSQNNSQTNHSNENEYEVNLPHNIYQVH